jgi:hypothetical protein
MTHQDLVALIDRHLETTGETPTAFGWRVAKDGSLVPDIRKGRSPRLCLVERIVNACRAA